MSSGVVKQVLHRRNKLRQPGTWHDAFEGLSIVGLAGCMAVGFNDWRLALPLVVPLVMHAIQLYMFLSKKHEALIEWTFLTFIIDIVVIMIEWALLYGYADTIMGTSITSGLADTKLNNIIKAAAMGTMVLMDLIRLRQYWGFEDEEDAEAQLLDDVSYMESLQQQQRAARMRAVLPAGGGYPYYATATKAV